MSEETSPDPIAQLTGGYAEGEIVKDVRGAETGEKVVADYDEQGQLIGWHKEAANG